MTNSSKTEFDILVCAEYLTRTQGTHGARWAPAPLLERLVAEKRGFGSADSDPAVQKSR